MSIGRPRRRHQREARLQDQFLVLPVRIRHDELVGLRGRLSGNGDIGNACREGAPDPENFLVNHIAHTMGCVSQGVWRTDEALGGHMLTRQRVEQVKIDRDIASIDGRDASDHDVVVADGLPIRQLHAIRACRRSRHFVARQSPEPAASLQIVLHDLGDIQSAVRRHGALERHDGDRHRVADPGRDFNLQLGVSRAHTAERKCNRLA